MVGRLALGSLFLAAGLSALAFFQTREKVLQTATSTVSTELDSEGNEVVVTTNRRFTHTDWSPNYKHPDPANRWMTLLEEFRHSWYPGMEGTSGRIKVEAKIGRYPNANQKIWTVEVEGDDGEAQSYFYKATKYGCCGAPRTYQWFSLITGEKLFVSTDELLVILRPLRSNLLNRYFAYHDSGAIILPKEGDASKGLVGIIQYGSEKGIAQKILVHARSGKWDVGDEPKVGILYQGKIHTPIHSGGDGLMLEGYNMRTDKAFFSGFSIKLNWYGGQEVVIPVENDELQINKAKVAEQFLLELTK
jgi:hypothetical protein